MILKYNILKTFDDRNTKKKLRQIDGIGKIR